MGWPLEDLSTPIVARNIDGTNNIVGVIRKQVRLLIWINRRPTQHIFYVIKLSDIKEIILGSLWLNKMNPLINWETRDVTIKEKTILFLGTAELPWQLGMIHSYKDLRMQQNTTPMNSIRSRRMSTCPSIPITESPSSTPVKRNQWKRWIQKSWQNMGDENPKKKTEIVKTSSDKVLIGKRDPWETESSDSLVSEEPLSSPSLPDLYPITTIQDGLEQLWTPATQWVWDWALNGSTWIDEQPWELRTPTGVLITQPFSAMEMNPIDLSLMKLGNNEWIEDDHELSWGVISSWTSWNGDEERGYGSAKLVGSYTETKESREVSSTASSQGPQDEDFTYRTMEGSDTWTTKHEGTMSEGVSKNLEEDNTPRGYNDVLSTLTSHPKGDCDNPEFRLWNHSLLLQADYLEILAPTYPSVDYDNLNLRLEFWSLPLPAPLVQEMEPNPGTALLSPEQATTDYLTILSMIWRLEENCTQPMGNSLPPEQQELVNSWQRMELMNQILDEPLKEIMENSRQKGESADFPKSSKDLPCKEPSELTKQCELSQTKRSLEVSWRRNCRSWLKILPPMKGSTLTRASTMEMNTSLWEYSRGTTNYDLDQGVAGAFGRSWQADDIRRPAKLPLTTISTLTRNDHHSPPLPHCPLSTHGTLHLLACICPWQDHHFWKEHSLGSSENILTSPLEEGYKILHPNYCPNWNMPSDHYLPNIPIPLPLTLYVIPLAIMAQFIAQQLWEFVHQSCYSTGSWTCLFHYTLTATNGWFTFHIYYPHYLPYWHFLLHRLCYAGCVI